MRVILARVGERAEVFDMDTSRGTLAALQQLVDGYIERVVLDHDGEGGGVDAWVHDEGRYMKGFNRLVPDMAGNLWDLYGDIVVARFDDEGETLPLSVDDVKRWLPRLNGGQP